MGKALACLTQFNFNISDNFLYNMVSILGNASLPLSRYVGLNLSNHNTNPNIVSFRGRDFGKRASCR